MINNRQAYALLSQLSTTGRISAVLERVRKTFPDLEPEAKKFLDLYDRYHDKREFRHGNGYIDVKAFKKSYAEYRKGPK